MRIIITMKESNWVKAEEVFASMSKGTVVTDFDMQMADIDVITQHGNTVSIKSQNDCYKYNSVLFEIELQSTYTNKQPIQGSLHKCEAQYYVVYMNDCNVWMMFNTAKLKEFVLNGTHHTRTTNKWTEESNRKQGRTYDRGVNITIPPKALLECEALIKTINYAI